jgi:hypothetical protein
MQLLIIGACRLAGPQKDGNMGIKQSMQIGISIGMLILLPAISMAKDRSCVTGPPTPRSYTWDFSREASRLLKDMRYDSLLASHHAAVLQTVALNPDESWASRAYQLSRIRAEVDDMGKRLCRLETIRRAVAPWEQQAIEQIAPLIQDMADNAADAINYLNAHQAAYWTPSYRVYTENLYTEATMLHKRIRRDHELGKQSEFGT